MTLSTGGARGAETATAPDQSLLMMEQAAVEVAFAQLQAGAHPPPRSRATVEE